MKTLKKAKRNYHGMSVKDRIKKVQRQSSELGLHLDWEQAKELYNHSTLGDIYLNDIYQVILLEGKDCDDMVLRDELKGRCSYLSIKRIDKQSIHDWRDLQEIKNQLCGDEREALEIYPAESRLVDTANQYHLFVMPEGDSVPFGFEDRFVDRTERKGGIGEGCQRGQG
jgi:hypothetical protein